jgi:hypothetical protein
LLLLLLLLHGYDAAAADMALDLHTPDYCA